MLWPTAKTANNVFTCAMLHPYKFASSMNLNMNDQLKDENGNYKLYNSSVIIAFPYFKAFKICLENYKNLKPEDQKYQMPV